MQFKVPQNIDMADPVQHFTEQGISSSTLSAMTAGQESLASQRPTSRFSHAV